MSRTAAAVLGPRWPLVTAGRAAPSRTAAAVSVCLLTEPDVMRPPDAGGGQSARRHRPVSASCTAVTRPPGSERRPDRTRPDGRDPLDPASRPDAATEKPFICAPRWSGADAFVNARHSCHRAEEAAPDVSRMNDASPPPSASPRSWRRRDSHSPMTLTAAAMTEVAKKSRVLVRKVRRVGGKPGKNATRARKTEPPRRKRPAESLTRLTN